MGFICPNLDSYSTHVNSWASHTDSFIGNEEKQTLVMRKHISSWKLCPKEFHRITCRSGFFFVNYEENPHSCHYDTDFWSSARWISLWVSNLNWSFSFPHCVNREKQSLPEVLVILVLFLSYKHPRQLVWAALQKYLLLEGGRKPLGLLRSVSWEELKLFEPFLIPTHLFLWFQNVVSGDTEGLGGEGQERRRGLHGRVKSECIIFIYVLFKPLPSLKFLLSYISSYHCFWW